MSRHFEKPESPTRDSRSASRRPTMRDVAAAAGVSVSAVSIAMRESPGISSRTRAKIFEAARSLGYQRNRAASLMKLTHTGIIGLTLNPANPFHVDLSSRIHRDAAQLDREIVPTFTSSPADEREAIEFLQGLRCDGLILLGTALAHDELAHIATHSALTVIGHRTAVEQADVIYAEDDYGQRAIVNHLAALGHRNIAHIDGGENPLSRRRRSGFERAMKNAGLKPHMRIAPGGQTVEAGQHGAKTLLALRPRPTAICAFNDAVALGAYDTIAAQNLRIPDDISLTGYDNTPPAALNFINLTTVDQRPERLTRFATESVVHRMQSRISASKIDSTTIVIEPDFIARATTAPPPAPNT